MVYHRRIHSETGQAPAERYAAVIARHARPEQLAEAFRWSQQRKVTKVGTVSMFNNTYQVEPHLVGRSVELTFDPFDLTRIDVLCDGQPAGVAAPLVIGRHSHPRATPEIPETMPVPATGIDYLALIDAARDGEVARTVNYAALIHTHNEHDEHESTATEATGTRPDAEDHSDTSAREEDTVGAR